jgi:hypothetical protein
MPASFDVVVTGSRVRVTVEIERAAATVSGQTCIEHCAAVQFYGWLELIDQLEGALDQPTISGQQEKSAAAPDRKEPDDICET